MTRAATILTSLLSAIIGGLIVGGLLLFFTLNSDTFQSLKPVKNGAGAGYKILTDFECRYGQTKHILMNGVDDNFALDKPEPSRRHPRLAHLPGLPINMPYKRDYDEMGRDKVLVDYFEVPPRVERGLFVTRLEHSDNYENDYLIIGDAWEDSVGLRRYGRHLFNVLLNEIDTLDGWTHSAKNIYSARLRDIKFRDKNPEVGADYQRLYKNLLQLIQSQDKEGVIDVMVADDTTADFMGLAICTEPENNKGLTFALVKQVEALTQNFQLIGCDLEPTSIHCTLIMVTPYALNHCPLPAPRRPADQRQTSAQTYLFIQDFTYSNFGVSVILSSHRLLKENSLKHSLMQMLIAPNPSAQIGVF